MLRTLKAWLNGTRHYHTGVELFKILSQDKSLLAKLAKGPSLYNNYKLHQELSIIYDQLKQTSDYGISRIQKAATSSANQTPTTNIGQTSILTSNRIVHKIIEPDVLSDVNYGDNKPIPTVESDSQNANPELYAACLEKAQKVYKIKMNKRALLFDMVPADQYSNPNAPDIVECRKDLALEILRLDKLSSELFDIADFVKKNGHLPHQDKPAEKENPYLNIPDIEVKPSIDNLRKNMRKMEKREQTPERIALLQKHDRNLQYLLNKWQSLQQKK